MKFYLNEEQVQYAIANPYSGNANPEAAAIGRVAEPIIIGCAEKQLDCEIREYNDPALPEIYKQQLGIRRRHDGLIFTDGKFQGINETKIISGPAIWLPLHEYKIYQYCTEVGLIYLLTLGICLNKSLRQCEYLGVVDFDKFAKQKPHLFTEDKLVFKGKDYKYVLNFSDFKDYFVE